MGALDDYNQHMAELRRELAAPADLLELVRYATLAANGHNTQPWLFRVRALGLTLAPDLTRRTPVVDPDDHHLHVSLGCALENLVLAGRARGFRESLALGEGEIDVSFETASPEESPLVAAIPQRQSTRGLFDGRPVAPAVLEELAACRSEGVELVLLTEKEARERVLEVVVAANTAQMADRAFVRELAAWIRFNPRAALRRGDGLFSGATGNPSLPTWLGEIMFGLAFRASVENDKIARQIRSSAGLAVFFGAREDFASWIDVGRSCQRFALKATTLGLRCSFLNQPVEVPQLRASLAAVAGLPGRRPNLLLRFGRGPALPFSPRRRVADVLAPAP